VLAAPALLRPARLGVAAHLATQRHSPPARRDSLPPGITRSRAAREWLLALPGDNRRNHRTWRRAQARPAGSAATGTAEQRRPG
jgi:hypothetical protein